MNLELSNEAQEYGRTAAAALEPVGPGVTSQGRVTAAERRVATEAVLGELGAWDLEPFGHEQDLEAAAALCRSAGYRAVPTPVPGRLCRPRDLEAAGLVVVGRDAPRGWLDGRDRWVAVDLDGRRSWATARAAWAAPTTAVPPGRQERPGANLLELETIDDAGGDGLALALVLGCWGILGMLDRALLITRAHVLEREQFGQRLAAFQSVQFQLSEAEVERSGLEELATYTLWSVGTGTPGEAVVDALALRLGALETAGRVFRVAHQLHGASGFCDDSELSWLSRHSQLDRRLPFGLSATLQELTRRAGRRGIPGIFGPDEVPYPF